MKSLLCLLLIQHIGLHVLLNLILLNSCFLLLLLLLLVPHYVILLLLCNCSTRKLEPLISSFRTLWSQLLHHLYLIWTLLNHLWWWWLLSLLTDLSILYVSSYLSVFNEYRLILHHGCRSILLLFILFLFVQVLIFLFFLFFLLIYVLDLRIILSCYCYVLDVGVQFFLLVEMTVHLLI